MERRCRKAGARLRSWRGGLIIDDAVLEFGLFRRGVGSLARGAGAL
jgi:hypothetical protein